MSEFFEVLPIKAATIDELLSDAFEPLAPEKADAEMAAGRLASWCRSSANGDWELLARRFERDGLRFDQVLRRFSRVRMCAPEPGWVSDARWILACLQMEPEKAAVAELLTADGDPIAFSDLIAPLVSRATELAIQPYILNGLLAASAVMELRRGFAQRVTELMSPALYAAFAGARKASADFEGDAADRRYREFIASMRAGGLMTVFSERPVLLRLIASTTRQWIDCTEEFLRRLSRDADSLRALIAETGDLTVVAIRAGVGDLHNKGRSVHLLEFAGGSKLLYKPRDLRVEVRWSELIDSLNAAAPPVELRTARVVLGEGYGWVEYIPYADCLDDDSVRLFYRRAGAWLCLMYILAGTDIHEDNIIANGSHPVAIDLETVFQPEEPAGLHQVEERRAFEIAGRAVSESVLMTGMLPAYGKSPENALFGHGGLHNLQNSRLVRGWRYPNTDRMEPLQSWEPEPPFGNIPSLAGKRITFSEYIEQLVEGFQQYAFFLCRYRDQRGSEAVLSRFHGLPVRRLLRPTRFYSLLLERLRDYRNMGDGVHWSSHLDFLSRLMDWDAPTDPWWPLLRVERDHLAQLNVPMLQAVTSSDEIGGPDHMVARTGAMSGYDRANMRLNQLGPDQIAWQSEIIRLSTSSLRAFGKPTISAEAECREFGDQPPDISVLSETLHAVAAEISTLAIRSGPSAAWLGLDWLRDSAVCQLAPLGADMYNGAPGVSLFLSAYARAFHDRRAAALAIEGLSAVRHDLTGANAGRFARALGTGGSTGLASVIYALTTAGELLADYSLVEDALAISQLFTHEFISADDKYDVMEGCAGGILGLLKLHRSTNEPDVLSRARECGEHLLKRRRPVSAKNANRDLGWGGGTQLNGLSHGAAGYSYAMAALAAATGDSRYAKTAIECIAFENSSFCIKHSNWPDLRASIDNNGFWPTQWCHGATGIGLARLGLIRLFTRAHRSEGVAVATGSIETPSPILFHLGTIVADMERAIESAMRAWPYPFESLCCGSLGTILFLDAASSNVEAGRSNALRAEARRRATAVCRRAQDRGDFSWDVGTKRFNLGLFRGLAGVGYTLSRLLEPSIPNILIWE